jgi:hypothetical protein
MTMSKNNGAELGPTGEYPRGKLTDDEGEFQFIVGTTQSGEVFLDFGTKVKWIAMEPGEAIELAKIIAANAQKGARVRQVLAQKKGAGLVGADGKPIK